MQSRSLGSSKSFRREAPSLPASFPPDMAFVAVNDRIQYAVIELEFFYEAAGPAIIIICLDLPGGPVAVMFIVCSVGDFLCLLRRVGLPALLNHFGRGCALADLLKTAVTFTPEALFNTFRMGRPC